MCVVIEIFVGVGPLNRCLNYDLDVYSSSSESQSGGMRNLKDFIAGIFTHFLPFLFEHNCGFAFLGLPRIVDSSHYA